MAKNKQSPSSLKRRAARANKQEKEESSKSMQQNILSHEFHEKVAKTLGYTGAGTSYQEMHRDKLEIEWTIGGQTGGSCWDTNESVYQPVSAEPEPEFEELDKVLEAFWPNITYLQYKALVNNLVSRRESHESAYYGNWYEKAYKTVDLVDLEAYLKEKGVWGK